MMDSVLYAKGHGTGNDFVILPDPDGALTLTPGLVAALCDRHLGIGGDGVLRVTRASAGDAAWFMDYWNADGSLAEMCGNGVRVFARYLIENELAEGPTVPILTRSGVVVAEVGEESIAVDMPLPVVYAHSTAKLGEASYRGTVATSGNPHLVCPVPDPWALDLSGSPALDPSTFPTGANVEFIRPAPGVDGADLRVEMRVIERGSGETQSCGSGACAAAAVALRDADLASGTVIVDVPGGRLTVTLTESRCVLSGPAVIVATGTVDVAALTRAGLGSATTGSDATGSDATGSDATGSATTGSRATGSDATGSGTSGSRPFASIKE